MTQEALKLALEALKRATNYDPVIARAITAIKQALAQEQEPVACGTYQEVTDTMNALWAGTLEQIQIAEEMKNKKLYSTPPQRKPLTIGDVKIIWQNLDVREGVIMGLVRAVEAAHDIKENT